jgi:hypothetical protein
MTDSAVREPNPAETLLQLAGGAVLPRCLHAVANLGVADVLGDTPQPAAALAAATGSHPEALDRALRLLSAYGVFQRFDGGYGHSAASRLLRADHPHSMRPMARMMGLPMFWASIGELEHSVRTALPATDKALPGGAWQHLAAHPEDGRLFNQAMTAKSHGHIAGVLDAYDFSGFGLIGDIGGGHGHLLKAVLGRATQAKGVLFDQPHVIDEVKELASDRLTLQAGDFFTGSLPACDAYLLMEVLHDWDDRQVQTILRNVRSAARPDAKLLIVEIIMPEGPGPNWAKTMDIWMLMIGGKQRTRKEYEALLPGAGFRLNREIATHAGTSIIEAVPA